MNYSYILRTIRLFKLSRTKKYVYNIYEVAFKVVFLLVLV